MAATTEFFNTYLPNKLTRNPELAASTRTIFQFDIKGAGTWTLDLSEGEGSVSDGPHESPGCVISADQKTWETILESPKKAVQMVMMGKLKVSNLGLATQLQKILG